MKRRRTSPLDRDTSRERLVPIVTPEGVALHFHLAARGDRLAAFLLDVVLIVVLMVMVFVLGLLATSGFGTGGDWVWALVLLAVFLLQNFYFIYFETRARGTTPGKRRIGIRVMESEGGSLTTAAVVVRNVMRILEVQIPLIALLVPEALWPGIPGWVGLLASVWLIVMAGMPLFNRRRLRVGDMVAGTIVVTAPKTVLLADQSRPRQKQRERGAPAHAFTQEQLDVYGEYELQVLEDLLRRDRAWSEGRRARRAVADRIANKIGWTQAIVGRDVDVFLQDFYAALRARLEQRMLFGKRKKDKYSNDE
jgi:uncharacterized RDD family membrane protein YckC